MKVGILLLTHGGIAQALIKESQRILPTAEKPTAISVLAGDHCESIRSQLVDKIKVIDQGMGVLVLTDIEGATPCNQIVSLIHSPQYRERVSLVTGVNLPMLLKVLNYAHEPLARLVELAVIGGTRGIHPEANSPAGQ